jgi:acyl carrier protein
MSDEIIQSCSAYIAKEILKKPGRLIQPDEPLLSSGLIDSFHLVDLGIFVEDTFEVRIEDFELNADNLDTLTQLASLIRSRQAR